MDFEFTEPVIFKDKKHGNKKWFISYSIKYPHKDKTFTRRKEYGKNLNREKDLVKRHEDAEVLRKMIHNLLLKGVDPKNKNSAINVAEAKKKEIVKYSFDTLFDFYCKLKGFDNPEPKQEKSARNVKRFFTNQFRDYLIKNGLAEDIRKITKSHVLDFLNSYYFQTDPKKGKWGNTTFNNIKNWISWFFNSLIEEDKIKMINPCDTIPSKPKKGKKRYEVFTKEELTILFDFLDSEDFSYSTACKMIYYAYIRESELERLKVRTIDLDARMIRIPASDAKGHSDGLEKDVVISKELKESLTKYLNDNPNDPDMYLFGKKFVPSPRRVGSGWHERFREYINHLRSEVLKKDHKSELFSRDGLSLYALKHSGVSHFIADNLKNNGGLKVLRFIQSQCRHEEFRTTEIYIRKLPVDIGEYDDFIYNGF